MRSAVRKGERNRIVAPGPLRREHPGLGSLTSHSVPCRLVVPGGPSQSPGGRGLSHLPAFAGSLPLHTHTLQPKADKPLTGLRARAAWLGDGAQPVSEQRLFQNVTPGARPWSVSGFRHEAPLGQDMEGEVASSLAEATLPSGASVSFSVSTPISTLMRHRVDEKRGAALGGSRSGFAPLLTCSCPSPGSSGFLPGVCGVAVGYPLDTVKVWRQPGPRRPPKGPWLGLGYPPSLLLPSVARRTFRHANQPSPCPSGPRQPLVSPVP